jgi:hypothetical protein
MSPSAAPFRFDGYTLRFITATADMQAPLYKGDAHGEQQFPATGWTIR